MRGEGGGASLGLLGRRLVCFLGDRGNGRGREEIQETASGVLKWENHDRICVTVYSSKKNRGNLFSLFVFVRVRFSFLLHFVSEHRCQTLALTFKI